MIRRLHYTSLLFFTFILLSHAQAQYIKAQRVVYEFTFQKDTTDVSSKTKDQYVLDIFDTHSKYVSITKLKSDAYVDSLSRAIELQGGIQNVKSITINKSNMGTGASYEIYKFSDGKIKFQQKLQRNNYGYEEDMSVLNWNITSNIEKYGQYNCQLAKTVYGGRNWNALFTTEIPVNNGPYKFSGLPGLIVKMWDDRNQCVFELVEIKNITDGNDKIPSAEIIKKKTFIISEENSRTPDTSILNFSEEMKRNIREREKKNNNRLELL